jgi:hypothetical protein
MDWITVTSLESVMEKGEVAYTPIKVTIRLDKIIWIADIYENENNMLSQIRLTDNCEVRCLDSRESILERTPYYSLFKSLYDSQPKEEE